MSLSDLKPLAIKAEEQLAVTVMSLPDLDITEYIHYTKTHEGQQDVFISFTNMQFFEKNKWKTRQKKISQCRES